MRLDRMQRASVEAIRNGEGTIRLETGDEGDESYLGLVVFGDRRLRHELALAYQGYFDRQNQQISRNNGKL